MRGPHRSCCYGAEHHTVQHSALSPRCDLRSRARRRPADGPVLTVPGAVDASTLLVYIMDVYDPWSYAYLPSVSAVLSEARSLVDVEIVQSGHLLSGGLSSFVANVDAVRGSTDARFGPEFLDALSSGSLVVDGEAAAAGVIALLATEQMPVSTVIGAVQHEFFVCGQPLEAPGVLGRVATNLGLDAQAIELFAASARAHELAIEDFAVARDLNTDGRPLLLASRGDRLFEFDGLGASSQRLVDQFRTVLARP